MEKKTVATRLDEETRAWLDGYAKRVGASQSAVLEQIVLGFRSGVDSSGPVRPPVRVPSPEESGTAHWRDPTDEEVEDTRRRYAESHPDVVADPARLRRLARAEAKARDQGRLPAVGESVGRDVARPVEADGAKGGVREESSFDRLTLARAKFFRGLDTKPPDGVTHGRGEKPRERPPAG